MTSKASQSVFQAHNNNNKRKKDFLCCWVGEKGESSRQRLPKMEGGHAMLAHSQQLARVAEAVGAGGHASIASELRQQTAARRTCEEITHTHTRTHTRTHAHTHADRSTREKMYRHDLNEMSSGSKHARRLGSGT